MSKRKPKSQPEAETNKGGRPTKLTDDVLHQIVTLIRGHNCYLETAANFAGISRRTLFDWLRRGREEENLGRNTVYVRFLHAIEKASAEAQLRDLAAIGQSDDWKAKAWRLERRYPKLWGRQEYVEVEQVEQSSRVTAQDVMDEMLQDEQYVEYLRNRAGDADAGPVRQDHG